MYGILAYVNIALCFFCTILYGAFRNRPNGVCGIRIPYTINYPHIWRKTHTASFLVGIPCCIIDLWCLQKLPADAFLFVSFLCLLFPIVIGCIIAAILGSQQMKQDAREEEQQRLEAERKEQNIFR